jgi:nucleotide-binding universal stress UspA family protein
MKTVLCPIDFSTLAERELRVAVEVSDTFGARLVLHHNVSAIAPGFAKAWEWDELQKNEVSAAAATARLRALMADLPTGVHAESRLTHGPIATVVLLLAEQLPADLLVLGTHGWSTDEHASVTERLVERAPCPVLTVRDAAALGEFRLRAAAGIDRVRVVIPTDFSPSATAAVAYGVRLAQRLPLELHLVHVCPPTANGDGCARLAALVPPQLSERTHLHVRSGQAVAEITAVLDQVRPQFVVMGTHNRSFWRDFFTGNTALNVLHGVRCPVWFVPTPRGSALGRNGSLP